MRTNVVVKDHTKLASTIDKQVAKNKMIVTKESELAGKVKDPNSNLGPRSHKDTKKESKGNSDKKQLSDKNNSTENKRKN